MSNFLENLGLFRFVSVCYELVLFVSVVSILVRNTETNRKCVVFGFTKQTETNPKQILFRFVSVRTEINFCLFRGHPIRGSGSAPKFHGYPTLLQVNYNSLITLMKILPKSNRSRSRWINFSLEYKRCYAAGKLDSQRGCLILENM